jgi:conjugal transfer pilus assembly protein TraL
MKIPPTVDAPPQLLGKDMDEVAVVSLLFMFGIMSGQLLVSVISIFFVSKAYKKFRGGVQEGYLIHMLYWSGIYIPKTPSVINPFVRDLS